MGTRPSPAAGLAGQPRGEAGGTHPARKKLISMLAKSVVSMLIVVTSEIALDGLHTLAEHRQADASLLDPVAGPHAILAPDRPAVNE